MPTRFLAAALVLAWSFAAAAAEPTPAEKLRQILDKTVDINIDGQPFHLALNQIKEEFKLPLVLDRFTIQQIGMDPEQVQVNYKAKNVKLRSALRSILSQLNLGYGIIGDHVLVTTDEMAMYRQMRQRVSVDIEKKEFAAALKQLSRDTGVNLMVDARCAKEAKGNVTLELDDVPLETAVRLMSEMVGLKPVCVGNVMFITTKAAAKELKSDTDLVPPNAGGTQPYVLPPGAIPPGFVGPMGIPARSRWLPMARRDLPNRPSQRMPPAPPDQPR